MAFLKPSIAQIAKECCFCGLCGNKVTKIEAANSYGNMAVLVFLRCEPCNKQETIAMDEHFIEKAGNEIVRYDAFLKPQIEKR